MRRVIRLTIIAWLVGAGVQWARRHGRSLGPLDRILDDRSLGKPPQKAAAGSAKAQLANTAAREASSSRTSRASTDGAAGKATTTATAEPETAAAQDEPPATAEPDPPAATVEPEPPAAAAEPDAPAGDDLKVIEGIGPKFEDILHAAGVDSFAKLAAMDAEAIQTIIRHSGARMADPTTWPEQSRLAAAGEWEALAEMHARLKGGREVNAD